jgi:hypothetical protein
MYQLVALVSRAGAGPARTLIPSMLASGASELRIAVLTLISNRGNPAAMINK